MPGKKKTPRTKKSLKKTTGRNPLARRKTAAVSSSQSSTPTDKPLREHLLYLLRDGGAHADFDHAIGDWPVQLAGAKVANFPHTAWMLLEHMRIAQWDILEFSRNPRHKSPPWPEGYWPETEMPPSEKAWLNSIGAYKKDLHSMEQLVADPRTSLYAKLPWGDGQTILREALLLADHNSYHLGQLVMLRKCIGI
ncbi:MAG: DinB family protein [Terriglobales bacterium]